MNDFFSKKWKNRKVVLKERYVWDGKCRVKKEDIKIEVEEGRVLRISSERKGMRRRRRTEDKWHRAERPVGKFWQQFRLPFDANLDAVKAHLENGVLKVTIPKLAEGKARQPRVIDIVEDPSVGDIRASKTDLK
ncbi:22.0 kDa class IV heat shock protein [Nymphaea colorata]|uniref:SHSP domain-containing protein n=1 Tax=Nymphaea colorata TaxID=210225 RepID=A0A5K1HVD8_9MAGN|nr:22.0 kDa class IV heat shock protein [Nymphaea colorata]VVW91552.1 unnamed protein product [Nymphaea colorata]